MTRKIWLTFIVLFPACVGLLCAKPVPVPFGDAKNGKAEPFKPVEINEGLNANDPVDAKLNNPSKRYPVKLQKDKTYAIDLISKDFDAFVRLLNKKGDELASDDDGGSDGNGSLHARLIYTANANEEHQIVATSLDGQVGAFALKVRELQIKGEAKARKLDKNRLDHAGELAQGDATDLRKPSRVVSVDLPADKAYLFEIDSTDFDCELYVFDGMSRLLGHAADKVISSATKNGPHHLVVASFDDKVGKFNLKIREFSVKGEAKAREVGKGGLAITANINQNDETPVGKLGKIYSVHLKAGQTYTLDLAVPNLDAYLFLFDSKSKLLAQDDDSGGNLDSRISFRCEADGVYHILATTLDGMDTGEFTLNVRKSE